MITIIGFENRVNDNGELFNILKLRGEIEMVKSVETGRYYATAKQTSITCTFDDDFCQQLIGKKMPGSIDRVSCDPYEYTIEKTGEKIILEHTYEYNPSPVTTEEEVFEGLEDGLPVQ